MCLLKVKEIFLSSVIIDVGALQKVIINYKKMSKNNKVLIGSLMLAGMTSIGIYAMASAHSDNNDARRGEKNFSSARHERMDKIFEDKDYQAWQNEMKEHRGIDSDMVNKENFAKFAAMHKLREEGQDDEADKIRDELGLRGKRHGEMRGEHQGRGMMNEERKEHRGENRGGHFEDNDGDGHCDHLDSK